MTNKKADPSALFSDSISTFTQSATKAFNDLQAQIRTEVTRAEAETRQARNERDQVLKTLQDSKKELQKHKEEILACKASLKEAELTIKHHIENYALLQRETNQWKDQAKNWQEHFLRVEQERCSLSSRMDELVTERLIVPPVTPSYSSKPAPSATGMPLLPTYQSAVPPSSESPRGQQQSRSTAKTTKRKVPSQSELPPYSETAQTPQTAKASISNTTRSNRKQPVASASRAGKTLSEVVGVSKELQEPKQILIRRVHAVVEVKREEELDENLSSVPPDSPEEPALTPRRSRNARRARQIVDDDDEYVPEDASPEIGSNEAEEEAEDDELMIGAGDDLSFDVGSPSVARQASAMTKITSNKKRKLNATSSSKPKTRRKI